MDGKVVCEVQCTQGDPIAARQSHKCGRRRIDISYARLFRKLTIHRDGDLMSVVECRTNEVSVLNVGGELWLCDICFIADLNGMKLAAIGESFKPEWGEIKLGLESLKLTRH